MKKVTKVTTPTIATSGALQAKTDAAISAFKTLITNLKATNDEAAAAKAANAEAMNKLAAENAALDALTAQNDKIVKNVETLLNV